MQLTILSTPSVQNDVWRPTDSKNLKNTIQKSSNPRFSQQNAWFPLSELRLLKQVTADTLTAGAGCASGKADPTK